MRLTLFCFYSNAFIVLYFKNSEKHDSSIDISTQYAYTVFQIVIRNMIHDLRTLASPWSTAPFAHLSFFSAYLYYQPCLTVKAFVDSIYLSFTLKGGSL